MEPSISVLKSVHYAPARGSLEKGYVTVKVSIHINSDQTAIRLTLLANAYFSGISLSRFRIWRNMFLQC